MAFHIPSGVPGFIVPTILITVLSIAGFSGAQIPDPEYCYATSANSEPVSICMIPDGSGTGFEEAMLEGGASADATISVTVRDGLGSPIQDFPAEDVFLPIGYQCPPVCCPLGTIADGPTNADGMTTFTVPPRAGGSAIGAQVMIGTWPTPEFPVEFDNGGLFRFNSPDINGDLVVNLVDLAVFADDYFGRRLRGIVRHAARSAHPSGYWP